MPACPRLVMHQCPQVALGKASSDPLGTLGLLAVLRECLESSVKSARPSSAQQQLRQQDPLAGELG